MSTWIKQTPDDDLNNLLARLSPYMLFQPEIYGRLMDEKWRRHGKPLEEWAIAPVNSNEPIHDLEFIWYCNKANSPNDPDHQPPRLLVHEATRDSSEITHYECSCGVRDGDARFNVGIDNWWRVPGPFWWPTKEVGGVAHYGVCPHAKSCDDQDHAPVWIEHNEGFDPPGLVRCVCRNMYALGTVDEY